MSSETSNDQEYFLNLARSMFFSDSQSIENTWTLTDSMMTDKQSAQDILKLNEQLKLLKEILNCQKNNDEIFSDEINDAESNILQKLPLHFTYIEQRFSEFNLLKK